MADGGIMPVCFTPDYQLDDLEAHFEYGGTSV
jgi:hypothetical protein